MKIANETFERIHRIIETGGSLEQKKVLILGEIAVILSGLLDAKLEELGGSEKRRCEYWDDESCFCALNKPSAEKRGSWERIKDSPQEITQKLHTMRCSCCGEYQTAPYLGTFRVFNYCPNCGARMDLS